MFKILLVCTGNICRSPTAEAVLRAALAEAGCDGAVAVASAGTHDYHVGEGADPRSVAAAARRGVDLSRHVAQQIRPRDFHGYDLILALDRGHLRLLERLRPARAKAELGLLMAYAPASGSDEVPDPYFGGGDGFEHVLDLIGAASEGLAAALRARLVP